MCEGFAMAVGNFWVINENRGCGYFIQINEDNHILTTIEGQVPGYVGSFSVYGSKYENVCITRQCSAISGGCQTKEDASRELGRHTFKNLKRQNCFFDPYSLVFYGDGGFFSYTEYFSRLSFGISCEDSSSIPDYCAKSEKYAEQVLLENERAKCNSIGGDFDGGVYLRKMPTGETEYCVSGSCKSCESKWRDDQVNDWNDSVCCGERGLEPNQGRGQCREAGDMDSVLIGVKSAKMTAFPGCSGTPAGKQENGFCKSSSSSAPPSSSSEPLSSSSREPPSSSSGGVSSSSGNIPSSSSGEISSSSSEPGICAVSKSLALQKPASYDDWVYIGKETYGSKAVRQSSLKPGSKLFDALGRVYNKIVKHINQYVFKESIDRKEYDVAMEFEQSRRGTNPAVALFTTFPLCNTPN
ncbi:hypothetical protein R83H12_00245 [Fibrobacteria bacterium R8-3-H12]